MKILYLSIIMLSLSSIGHAQLKGLDSKINIETKELIHRGDSVYVEFIVNSSNAPSVRNSSTMNITPMFSVGSNTLELPLISFKNNRDFRYYNRKIALLSAKGYASYAKPYRVINTKKDNTRQLLYKCSVPFEPWMSDAQLAAKIEFIRCGVANDVLFKSLATRVNSERVVFIENYQVTPYLAYIQPEAEVPKKRADRQELVLDFDVNSAVLKINKGNNMEKLEKTVSGLDNVRNAKGVSVRGIVIVGYASPDGSLDKNLILSEARAKAVQDYLKQRYFYPNEMYNISFGEDWDYFTQIVAASDLKYRDQVIEVITSNKDIAQRKKALMQLGNGEVYRELVTTVFPTLRRVLCTIDYDVKSFDVDEAKEVFKTHPMNLSLMEMYAVAKTYEVGSAEFMDLFETAARLYPQDETALLNAASSMLSRGDYIAAERYLKNLKSIINTPEYSNTKGVLELLKGNYPEAQEYLQKAANAGVSAADLNLAELEKKQQEKSLENK